MFGIRFTEESPIELEPGEKGRTGLLVLGGHQERFVVHLSTWSEQQYVDHWNSALTRALEGKPSAVITDMLTPLESNHLVWWPMWRTNGEVVFHNQLLFFEKHKIQGSHIDVERLYELVGERSSRNEKGSAISEWAVPVSAVEAFLATSA